jgi:hypothetical protein
MVKKLLLFLTLACFGISSLRAQKSDEPLFKPEPHEFIIHSFRTESGVTLPEAKSSTAPMAI